MDGYGRATYGDAFADVYDEWYADVSPPADTAAFMAERVHGLVVELGSGTGRLAGPLRAAGVPVVGLDASIAMLRRSRHGHPGVPVAAADMAEPPLRPASAAGVLIAFNTLFNLPTTSRQRRCLREAADLLHPDGIVVIEAFVPADGAREPSSSVDVVRLDTDVVVLRVSRTDGSGLVSGHHVELRDGAPVRLRPWEIRFTDPEGLDTIAASAGLALVERCSDWRGGAFGDASPMHVSVYRLAQPRR